MSDWHNELQQLLASGETAVLVTIAGTRGSTPRETGATMLVTATETIGTIGGGQLEYQSTQEACKWLTDADPAAPRNRKLRRKFILGANCGQCCGGVAEVLFEELGQGDIGRVEQLSSMHEDRFKVIIFGSGHVGSATAAVLSTLDADINLVDSRPGFLTGPMPKNVHAHNVADPTRMVASSSPNSFFVVMTHDHGLDFEICSQILQRDDAAFCGLIGSRSKRRRFEKRFRALGLRESQISRLICPIGISGIKGKKPAEIALSVAAQLQKRYEADLHSVGVGSDNRLVVVPVKHAIGGSK